MVKDNFYPTSTTTVGIQYTDYFGNLPQITDINTDPCAAYYMGSIPADLITSLTPHKFIIEPDTQDTKKTIIKFERDTSIAKADWGYAQGSDSSIYWNGSKYVQSTGVKLINSMEAYKLTKWGNITLNLRLYTYFDQTLDSGDVVQISSGYYNNSVTLTTAQFIDFVKNDTPITVSYTISGETITYQLKYSELLNGTIWKVDTDRFIACTYLKDATTAYYTNTTNQVINPFIHFNSGFTNFGHYSRFGANVFPDTDLRIQFNPSLTKFRYYNPIIGVNSYDITPVIENSNTDAIIYSDDFSLTGEILNYIQQNTRALVIKNYHAFNYSGYINYGGDTFYNCSLTGFYNIRDFWTIFCLHNKRRNSGYDTTSVYDTNHTIGMFTSSNQPIPDRKPFVTYPAIELELQDWQKYDHKIEENNYPVDSPLSLSLWSIKETKDGIKVANVFPYNHDAGEGTFFAQVRSKIKYDTLTRDENSEVIINGLRFEFEDAVRKSSWRDGAEEPEPYLLATYNFGQINSANFNSGENVIPKGGIQIENFPSEFDRIIDLKNNELIQGSYLGEVASYFDATDEKYDVWINISWKNRPSGYQGPGRLVIYDNNGTEEVSYNDFGPIAGYQVSLQKYDDEGKSITHTIKYQIYTYEGDIDNNWSVYVNNYKINYEDGIKTVGITNTYNKTNYYYDYGDHVLPVSKIFNDSDFINPSAFISYMKKLQVEAGKNPVKDWETYLKNQGEINNIKQNQVAFFLAKFTYSNEKFGGECFTIIPYLTIVIKENNDTSINTFEIIAKPPEQGDNPLANDMNENSQWSDENLIWPYYSKRNCDSQGHDQLGTASTKLFARKGCYIEGGLGHEWNDTNDDNVLSNYWETEVKTTTPYIGEPFGSNQIYYKIVDNNSINTVLSISQDFIPKISNFCIFIIDNNMADAHDVLSIVPYYYKVEIIVPINPASQNKLGTMFATLVFNPKEENYWDTNSAPYKDTDIQSYKAHMVYETPGKFVIQGEDSKVYLVSQGTVRDGMVGKEGEEEEFPGVQDVKDWINPNNKKEIFIT